MRQMVVRSQTELSVAKSLQADDQGNVETQEKLEYVVFIVMQLAKYVKSLSVSAKHRSGLASVKHYQRG